MSLYPIGKFTETLYTFSKALLKRLIPPKCLQMREKYKNDKKVFDFPYFFLSSRHNN